MNTQDIKELNDFISDHTEHFGFFPMEFEDSSGKVWTFSAFKKYIK